MGAHTNAPQPVARHAGRDGTPDSANIPAPGSVRETPFDLRPWAKARRFRTRTEESYLHETDPEARGDGQAYIEVDCHRGLIYSYNSVELLAWTSTRGVLAELLDAVAAVIRPRRRRTLDPARARAIGRSTAFVGAQTHEDALEDDGQAPGDDFIEWGFRTGMRKGEIAKLEWSMLDRGGPTWVLNLPGSISGHRTRSMLDRYNIVGGAETAAALVLSDRYFSAQPTARNLEEGHFGDIPAAVGAEVLTRQRRLAEAGGNRTHRSGGQPGAGRL